jgi:hypothetical protein
MQHHRMGFVSGLGTVRGEGALDVCRARATRAPCALKTLLIGARAHVESASWRVVKKSVLTSDTESLNIKYVISNIVLD